MYVLYTMIHDEIKYSFFFFLLFLSLKFSCEHYAEVPKLSFVSSAVHFVVSF